MFFCLTSQCLESRAKRPFTRSGGQRCDLRGDHVPEGTLVESVLIRVWGQWTLSSEDRSLALTPTEEGRV